MKKAVTCTDKYGGRISCNEDPNDLTFKDYDIFIIGDSFIQADELPYEETIYGLFNKKSNINKAYGFGMASWNSSQFLSAINAINEKGTHYDIFLFWNDFAPSSSRSRLGQSLAKSIDERGQDSPVIKLFQLLASKSITFQKITQLINRFAHVDYKNRDLFWQNYVDPSRDDSICTQYLPGFHSFHPVMQDYLSLTSRRACWGDLQKKHIILLLWI